MFGFRYCASVLVTAGLIVGSTSHATTAGPFIAFSLREAVRQTRAGQTGKDLLTLAGMTRVVGMVYDPNGDIILVGRVIEGLPGASLDDLVVALRARLVRDEVPTVSIDPTAETSTTGLQRVRFFGGLEGTQFGKDLEECDIFLKLYSLSLIPSIRAVQSYRAMVQTDLVESLRDAGVQVLSTKWLGETDCKTTIPELIGRSVRTTDSSHARFWFTPLGRPRLWLRDGVACIRELRLCVRHEVAGEAPACSVKESTAGSQATAGELFARRFTEHMREATAAQPLLQRLKILFDLTAVAELIHHIENPPDLTIFLKEYPVQAIPTRETYELIRIVGLSQRSDGLLHATEISGGIEFKMDVEWLNRGDCSSLRNIVLKTRPNSIALAWTLPLDTWRMPNYSDQDVQENDVVSFLRPAAEQDPGCLVSVESLALEPPGVGPIAGRTVFTGFGSPPETCFSGVSMRIEISNDLFEQDTSGSLVKERKEVMDDRPADRSLFWPLKRKGQQR